MNQERREWSVPLLPTGEEMANPGAYLRSVVRVFPDYADSVLWFVGGPVDYAEAKLSDSLATDMMAWDTSYYAGLDSDRQWRSPDLETHHCREGLRLARGLSDELGDAFEVEVFALDKKRNKHKVRLLGQREGTNPRAIAAFRARAAADEATMARIEDLKASGVTFGWTTHAPLNRNDKWRG
jgi:hypothetical protein